MNNRHYIFCCIAFELKENNPCCKSSTR